MCTAGVNVEGTASLIIDKVSGLSDSDCSLEAVEGKDTGIYDSAGIGGWSGFSGGKIIIKGGTITAKSIWGAGIGGGRGGAGGTILILGGSVTAMTENGSGIGGGAGGSAGYIDIRGGSVNAQASQFGQGIGAPDNGGNILISGGTVTASSYLGVGIICTGTDGTIAISGTADVKASGDLRGINGTTIGISGGQVNTSSSSGNCIDGNIVLISGGTINASSYKGAGIYGGTVTIKDGSVTTHSSLGPGICGNSNSVLCPVNILGGNVSAVSSNGAGIGGSQHGAGCPVTISGGNVNATSSNGAGIGGGEYGAGSILTISGGTVYADSAFGDAIGSGKNCTTGVGGVNYFSGGSIKADSLSSAPVISSTDSTPIYLTTLTLPSATSIGNLSVSQNGNSYSYGFKDVQPDGDNKLYFYLPVNGINEITNTNLKADSVECYYYGTVLNNNSNVLKMDIINPLLNNTRTYGDPDFNIASLAAAAASVNYSITSGSGVVEVSNNGDVRILKAGNATVTATLGTNDLFYDPASVNIVVNQKSISAAVTVSIADQTYTGNSVTPLVAVTDGGSTLLENTDFTVGYQNNINAAESSSSNPPAVIITGKGNYCGSISKTFSIKKVSQTGFSFGTSSVTKTYGDPAFKVVASGGSGSGSISYSVTSSPEVVSVNPVTGDVAILKAGNAVITATKAGDTNYNEAKTTISITVQTVNNPSTPTPAVPTPTVPTTPAAPTPTPAVPTTPAAPTPMPAVPTTPAAPMPTPAVPTMPAVPTLTPAAPATTPSIPAASAMPTAPVNPTTSVTPTISASPKPKAVLKPTVSPSVPVDIIINSTAAAASDGRKIKSAQIIFQDNSSVHNYVVKLGRVTVTADAKIIRDTLGSGKKLIMTQESSPAATKKLVKTAADKLELVPISFYDIKLSRIASAGNAQAINNLSGKLKVTITLTDSQVKVIKKSINPGLFYFGPENNKLTDMKVVFNLKAKTAVFTANHLSTFVLLAEPSDTQDSKQAK